MRLQRGSPVPLYQQLVRALQQRVRRAARGTRFPTEREISRKYGVSRFTVTRAVNRLVQDGFLYRIQGSGTYVRERTCRQSARLANILFFLPNSISHYIRTGDYPMGEMAQGIQDRLAGQANLVVEGFPGGREDTNFMLDRISHPSVDALILLPWRETSKLAHAALNLKKPFVLLNVKSRQTRGLNRVLADEAAGMKRAVNFLLESGHRRFLFVGGGIYDQRSVDKNADRATGYTQALDQAHVPRRRRFQVTWADEKTFSLLEQILRSPDPPTAIVTYSDIYALQILRELPRRGFRVPQDVSVVGFDDSPSAAASRPPLTSVRKPRHQMGVKAAELILSFLEDGFALVGDVYVDTELVVRESQTIILKHRNFKG